ncbi:MAG TPA: MerR family transcriptional regulator [bacterium]|nr:MerR family transcriptional regulator [bacterium]
MPSKDKTQPIQKVARLTGLNPHVIRMWEKRYQAVKPERTQTNRRAYTDEDIERLQLLGYLTREGHRIGQVARISLTELKELVRSLENEKRVERKAESEPEDLLTGCLQAVSQIDATALDLALAKATIYMSPLVLIETLVVPLIEEVLARVRQGKLRLVHERFTHACLRPFLVNFMKSYEVLPHAPRLISTCPAGQHQEFGALYAVSAAAASGWNATYLGPNLPAEEIAAAAHQLAVRLVILNLNQPWNDPRIHSELQGLRKLLAPEVKILAVGSGVAPYRGALEKVGALSSGNFPDLLEQLEDLHREVTHGG